MKHSRNMELPEDFWIPIALDTDNITALSPFLVPQDHLAGASTYYSMAVYMLFIFTVGTTINVLTIACTVQYKKLRSHLNYILVNLAVANLLVSVVGSFTSCCNFISRYFIFGPLSCKIEGFMVTLGAPPLFGWSRYIPEGLQCSCGPDWYTTNNKYNNESYVMFLFGFCFAVPLATIIFCYSHLLITLKMGIYRIFFKIGQCSQKTLLIKIVLFVTVRLRVCPWLSIKVGHFEFRAHTNQMKSLAICDCTSNRVPVTTCRIQPIRHKTFRSCMIGMIGMSGDEEESSTTQSTTEVSKVGPA
uniref:Putative blue sensitive visual pigment n=1 Tax=Dicentrarchus labrax TaxID=13489 RepID=E6ZFQ4_DICLA|nr:Putative blue sensitive visual pigment [Dicentrarchus labrax]